MHIWQWGVLAVPVLMALSKAQREAILQRDNYQSQMRHYSEELGWHTGGYCENGGEGCQHLQVHHIRPQSTFDDPNDPEMDNPLNLITLYECEHNGRCPEGKILPQLAKGGRNGR